MTSGKESHANGGVAMSKKTKLMPPDGGWGWMVVVGTASTNIFNQSMLSLFSLLYGDEIEFMGHKTQGAALVMSTMLFVTNFGGPISGSFLKLTSPRTVAVTGAILCTIGIFFSAFINALWHLVVTYGVLLGTGLGLIQTATFVAINGYFKNKKGRAIGLAMAGTGFGQMMMPFVIRYLLDVYGFTGCCCILGALSLHGFAGCLLLQPVEWHMVRVEEDEIDEKKHLLTFDSKVETNPTRQRKTSEPADKEEVQYIPGSRRATEPAIFMRKASTRRNSNSYKELNFANISSTAESVPMMNKDLDEEKPRFEVPEPTKKKSMIQKLTDLFDVRLLASPRFLNIIIGTALSVTSIQNFSLIFPLFLKHVASMDRFQVATCMSTVAGMDIVGRLTLPGLADRFKVKARVTLILTSIWLIVVRQFLAYQTTLVSLAISAGFYGFGRSMIIVARNIAISENCRIEQVPSAVGWGMMAMGIMVPPVGLFLGWLRDYTDSFIVCITAQNVLLVVLLITWIPDLMYIRYQEKKESNNRSDDVEM